MPHREAETKTQAKYSALYKQISNVKKQENKLQLFMLVCVSWVCSEFDRAASVLRYATKQFVKLVKWNNEKKEEVEITECGVADDDDDDDDKNKTTPKKHTKNRGNKIAHF